MNRRSFVGIMTGFMALPQAVCGLTKGRTIPGIIKENNVVRDAVIENRIFDFNCYEGTVFSNCRLVGCELRGFPTVAIKCVFDNCHRADNSTVISNHKGGEVMLDCIVLNPQQSCGVEITNCIECS
jgi:hypothetical protein